MGSHFVHALAYSLVYGIDLASVGAAQVLTEVRDCTEKFPNAYIRLVAFDSVRQVQCAGMLVHRPKSGTEYRDVEDRSI